MSGNITGETLLSLALFGLPHDGSMTTSARIADLMRIPKFKEALQAVDLSDEPEAKKLLKQGEARMRISFEK